MKWSKADVAFLENHYMYFSYEKIAKSLNRTPQAVKAKAHKLNFIKAERFSEQEVIFIRENYPHVKTEKIAELINRSVSSVYHKANSLGVKKTEQFLKSEESGMFHKGHKNGLKTCFKTGHTPHNKGKKTPEHIKEKSKHTYFKKGHTPLNTKALHELAIHKDKTGKHYYRIKVASHKWEYLHRYIYEKHNGKIPSGHNVVFKDGDQTNFSIDNLELLSNSELMLRNTIHNKYTKELAQLIQMKGALVRQINQLINKEDE